MGERSSYQPGTFCWVELATSDVEAAKRFYAELFGWQADDLPVGEDSVYSMQMLDGRAAGAIAPQPGQQRDAGIPPLWNSYVSVTSADETAQRAGELGASVHAGPFDVMKAGRMAGVQDPQGAFFMLWERGETFGAAVVNEPGALVWNELSVPDVDAARSFYGELFGWTTTPFEGGGAALDSYAVIHVGERSNGGIRELKEPSPPNWAVYFGVADIEDALSRVKQLGGEQMTGPQDIGIAKLAFVRDPQGAVFALYAGQLDP
ncbi:MAG: VOC family protein [Solirubrobacteraceae bacterium]